MLAKTSKRFVLLTKIRKKVRTFGYGLPKKPRRVRTFGHGRGKNSQKFVFLDIYSKGFAFFCIYRFGHTGFAVFDHKRYQAKTLEIWRPFSLHSAFINSSQKCIFLVDHVVEHFWCQFRQKGSRFWRCSAHSNKLLQGFALLAKFYGGFALLGTSCAKTLKGFALLGTCSSKPQKGSRFWRGFAKGFALLGTTLSKNSGEGSAGGEGQKIEPSQIHRRERGGPLPPRLHDLFAHTT